MDENFHECRENMSGIDNKNLHKVRELASVEFVY